MSAEAARAAKSSVAEASSRMVAEVAPTPKSETVISAEIVVSDAVGTPAVPAGAPISSVRKETGAVS